MSTPELLTPPASPPAGHGDLALKGDPHVVLSVEGAKTPETRQRRVDRAVEMLRERRKP